MVHVEEVWEDYKPSYKYYHNDYDIYDKKQLIELYKEKGIKTHTYRWLNDFNTQETWGIKNIYNVSNWDWMKKYFMEFRCPVFALSIRRSLTHQTS